MSGHAPRSLKSVYLIFIATFAFGFLMGVVLFLQGNTGKEGDGAIDTNTKGITILAYTYGGCERIGCSSYKIAPNGSYLYIVRNQASAENRKEGSLPYTELDALKSQVTQTDFTSVKQTKFTDTCPITYDGVAYRYDIEYNGERFMFDSCVENFTDAPLFKNLQNYFEVFSKNGSAE